MVKSISITILFIVFLTIYVLPNVFAPVLSTGEYAGAQAATISPKENMNKKARFTEAKHKQFMEDEDYARADALLNATWKLLKENLNNAQFREVQASQRQWLKSGREEEAGALLDTHSEQEAFTIALFNRANELASVISAAPRPGKYDAAEAQFKTTINGHTISIVGDATYGQNMCDFTGIGKISQGWITMRHDDFPDFYLLFTKNGAIIRYSGSGESQGCGMNVGFADDYVYSEN